MCRSIRGYPRSLPAARVSERISGRAVSGFPLDPQTRQAAEHTEGHPRQDHTECQPESILRNDLHDAFLFKVVCQRSFVGSFQQLAWKPVSPFYADG